MSKKKRDVVLNIISNENITKNNHRISAKVKKEIQRRVGRNPETKLLKKSDRVDDMQMTARVLQRDTKNLHNFRCG